MSNIDWSKRKTKKNTLKEKEDIQKEAEYQTWLVQKRYQEDLDNRAEYKRFTE